MFYRWLTAINWTPESITAAANVSLAFLTFILAFGSIFLWLSTRRLVVGAEKTAQRQLRAYISVGSHGIKPFRNYNQSRSTETIVHIGVRNVGQVPARNVRWFFDV